MRSADVMSLVHQMQREISGLKRQVKTLQSRPSLRHAAIDDAAVRVRDREGRTVQVIGKQADGEHGDRVIKSKPQPVPSGMTLDPGAGTASVGWPGEAQGRVPSVFGRVEVWAAPGLWLDNGDGDDNEGQWIAPPLEDYRHLSSIYSREGGSTTVKTSPGRWYFTLRMVGADGITASALAKPEPVSIASIVDDEDVRARVEEAFGGGLSDTAYAELMEAISPHLVVGEDQIAEGAIGAAHFAVGSLDGQTITGSLVQTDHADDRGLKFDSEGLYGYDTEGRVTIWIDGEQNRFAGTFRLDTEGETFVEIRTWTLPEITGETPDDEEGEGDNTAPLVGLGFESHCGHCGVTGVFTEDHGALTLVSGVNRPPGMLSGQWAAQDLRVIERFAVDAGATIGEPVEMMLLNGWRLAGAYPGEDPCYVQVGNIVFLRGAVLTPSGGGSSAAIANLPTPGVRRRLAGVHGSASGATDSPATLEVSAAGDLTVLNGDSLPTTNVFFDGLFYFIQEPT